VDATVEDPATRNLVQTTVFTLTGTSSVSGCSNTDEVTITIRGGALTLSPTASAGAVCAGEDVHLHAVASGGTGFYTYTWTSVPAGFTSSASHPFAQPTVSTDYRVSVFDGFTTVNNHVYVTVHPLPTTPVITADGPTVFCEGDSVGLASGAGVAYNWSNGDTTQLINVDLSGNYSVRIIDENGCESDESQEIVVTVNKLPITPTIMAGGPTVFCEGGEVTLLSSPGAKYLWSTGDTLSSLRVTASGTYSVSVLSTDGCQSAPSVASSITVISNPAEPVIGVSGPVTLCPGEYVILSTAPANEYTWSTGEGSQYITVDKKGNYTVKVRNSSGCQSPVSAVTAIGTAERPSVHITSGSAPMCPGDTRTLTGDPEGGIFSVTQGPGSVNAGVLTAHDSGYVEIVYNYTDFCSSSDTQFIQINSLPLADAGPDQVLEYAFETQLAALLATGETGCWFLSSGTGTVSDSLSPVSAVTGLSLGNNVFAWRTANGKCSAEDEVKITLNDVIIPSVITPNEDGFNDYFEVTRTLGRVELVIFNAWGNEVYSNANYDNDWNGKNNKGNDLPDDTYFFVVKFENGSVAKGSVLIKK
jgi:gliding motility-associated-like protein